MATSSEQRRVYQGPTIFSYGFRPFFFFGALWAALAIPLWILSYFWGAGSLGFEVGVVWHAHEMIFGYCSAIIAGFLLTAVPNWTGRLPIMGTPLVGLVLLWLVGRVGLMINVDPVWVGPVLDSAFLVVFSGFIWREVIAGKNKRNVKIAVVLSLLALANIGFHTSQTSGWVSFDQMSKIGLGLVLLLIAIIGGRVIPSFTANWLAQQGKERPTGFNRYDMFVMMITAGAIVGWVISPFAFLSGILMLIAGVVNFIRLIRWKFWETFAEPLVLVLHVGFGWVVAVFFLIGSAIIWPHVVPAVSGIHAIGTGVIGVMTLAIMTRATLGHTGRQLRADTGTVLIFVLINLAALSRVTTPFFSPDLQAHFTVVAAVFWCLAFSAFCVIYGRYLWRPRL